MSIWPGIDVWLPRLRERGLLVAMPSLTRRGMTNERYLAEPNEHITRYQDDIHAVTWQSATHANILLVKPKDTIDDKPTRRRGGGDERGDGDPC